MRKYEHLTDAEIVSKLFEWYKRVREAQRQGNKEEVQKVDDEYAKCFEEVEYRKQHIWKE